MSCWSHCPGRGCGQLRHLPGETRALAGGCSLSVGCRGWRRQPQRRALGTSTRACLVAWQGEDGGGWAAGVCPERNGSPARSRSPGQSPSVHEGGRAGRRRRQTAGPWSAIPGTKASTRGRGQECGGDQGDGDVGEGEGRRGARTPAAGDLGGGDRRADPRPSTRPQALRPPGLEVLVLHPSKDALHLGQEAPVITEQGARLPDVGDHPLQRRPREAGDEERHLQGIAGELRLVH